LAVVSDAIFYGRREPLPFLEHRLPLIRL
jgi:hypothetical protein